MKKYVFVLTESDKDTCTSSEVVIFDTVAEAISYLGKQFEMWQNFMDKNGWDYEGGIDYFNNIFLFHIHDDINSCIEGKIHQIEN